MKKQLQPTLIEQTKKIALCACKLSDNGIYYNGSHKCYEKLSYIMKSIEVNKIFACAFGEGKDYHFCDGSQSKKRY